MLRVGGRQKSGGPEQEEGLAALGSACGLSKHRGRRYLLIAQPSHKSG